MAGRRGRYQQQQHEQFEQAEQQQSILSHLQPEILPVQVMVDILQERGLKSAILQEAERAKVIHLFYKYISPKCQREYRDNRRGKILKKTRDWKAIKFEDPGWKKLVVESKSRPSLSSMNISSSMSISKVPASNGGERLKPPPSCINPERKTIKLGGKKSSKSDLDFLIIKRSSENSETEDNNKRQKLIENKRKSISETEDENKKLKVDVPKKEESVTKPEGDDKKQVDVPKKQETVAKPEGDNKKLKVDVPKKQETVIKTEADDKKQVDIPKREESVTKTEGDKRKLKIDSPLKEESVAKIEADDKKLKVDIQKKEESVAKPAQNGKKMKLNRNPITWP